MQHITIPKNKHSCTVNVYTTKCHEILTPLLVHSEQRPLVDALPDRSISARNGSVMVNDVS